MADILVDDHAEVDELLRKLLDAFDRGEAREVLDGLDYMWARLAVHIRAEHLHLFPALLAGAAEGQGAGTGGAAPAPEEVRATVERLREDHDFFMRELAAAVNAVKVLVARGGDAAGRLAEIKDRVQAVGARLAEHNRVEEEQVYRWPESLCGGAARDALAAGLRREVENLPPRFAKAPPR